MMSTINRLSSGNVSLCVYIGNTASIDDQILINYCSQFGKIVSCTILNCSDEKRSFCDFRIIEFATKQQLNYFLNRSLHKLGSIILDVKLYENLLNNFEILNIDRKLFIGPILNPNHMNIIVQFYKVIDPNLNFCLSRQTNQTYILIECSNRQYIRTIIQQQTIPQTFDNQIFTIHLPIHPKELISQQISTKNNRNQICVKDLTEQITENILIDYFEKRASVIACHILSIDPKCAIIEFENEKFVQKLLDQPFIRLHGVNLSLSKVTSTINDYNNDEIDQLLEATISPSPAIQNQSLLPRSPEIRECGWASPPRAVIIDHVSSTPTRLSSKPGAINSDPNYQSRAIETDMKPMKNVTNNICKFIEQFQNEIDQIKDEYRTKFTRDRTSIEHEINRLINDERIKFDKLGRYLYEHRRSSTKTRKHC